MSISVTKQFNALPVQPEKVPLALQQRGKFVVWRADKSGKKDGKAAKKPISIISGQVVDALNPANQVSFSDALKAHKGGMGSGIGIVLDGQPIMVADDDAELFLVGIDLDNIHRDVPTREQAKQLVEEVASYTEQSPSGGGLRIFCLSRHRPRSGQTTFGEMYSEKRFLTVTGHKTESYELVEATAAVKAIEQRWWGESDKRILSPIADTNKQRALTRTLSGSDWTETDQNISTVEGLLTWVPPGAPYEQWRNVIWAVASLGWSCGEKLVTDWSSCSAEHWQYDQGARVTGEIAALLNGFDPEKGISLGTLFHYAHDNGMPRPERGHTPLTLGVKNGSELGELKGSYFLSRDDLDALPPLSWTIRGVLPEEGLAAIYGEPGSGKSFLALDLAARISTGSPCWFGHQIFQRDVIYVALEGGRGIKQRVAAWDYINGTRADRIKFRLNGFTLLSDIDVATFIDAVSAENEGAAVIIIDTLAQATPGADENAGKDMGLVLQAAQQIAAAARGLVILIHHSGKDSSRGLRGHSSLNGAMDAVISVERNKLTGRRSWSVTKMKDAEDGAKGNFILEEVDLGPDNFGGRITSGVIKELATPHIPITPTQPVPHGANQLAVYDALKKHADAATGWPQDTMTEVAKVALSHVKPRHRASRARQTLDGLIAGKFIKRTKGGTFSLTQPSPNHPPHAPP